MPGGSRFLTITPSKRQARSTFTPVSSVPSRSPRDLSFRSRKPFNNDPSEDSHDSPEHPLSRSSSPMRNIKLIVEYDGTNYCGWQRQENGPTIQGEIESVLAKIFQEQINIVGAGRTDSGVH